MPNEAAVLSELCLRSKAVWGYDDTFLDACRTELTLTAAEIDGRHVQVAEVGGEVVGVAQLRVEGGAASLEKLFVDTDCFGLGVGRALLDWATCLARQEGATAMTIDADPGAVPFYRRMGAAEAGSAPSGSIPGRVLPRLRIAL